jgi:hypothetical protein
MILLKTKKTLCLNSNNEKENNNNIEIQNQSLTGKSTHQT